VITIIIIIITICRIQYIAHIFVHKYVSVHISVWVMVYQDPSAVYTEQVSVGGLCSSLVSHANKSKPWKLICGIEDSEEVT
jgi:hypothetical protein